MKWIMYMWKVISDFFTRKASTQPEKKPDPVIIPPTKDPMPELPPKINPPEHIPVFLWCLDNGHGSLSPGKRSPEFSGGYRLFEYEFNRDIVRRIIQLMDEIGLKYYNIVPEVEVGNILSTRMDRFNTKNTPLTKIFLSIHSNAAGNGSDWYSARGIETWYKHNDKNSKILAKIFQDCLIKYTGWKNRGIKYKTGNKEFYVLRNANTPAILTENGFYDNHTECQLLLQDNIRQKIAEAHVEAMKTMENYPNNTSAYKNVDVNT